MRTLRRVLKIFDGLLFVALVISALVLFCVFEYMVYTNGFLVASLGTVSNALIVRYFLAAYLEERGF